MSLRPRDNNEGRFNALMLLPKDGNPNYYQMLFKNAKSFFYGMNRPDLSEDLDYIIHHKIEVILGSDIETILIIYKNLPYLNSFTRSKNPYYSSRNIYKMQMQSWLNEIETWIFKRAIELEPQIRFTAQYKPWV